MLQPRTAVVLLSIGCLAGCGAEPSRPTPGQARAAGQEAGLVLGSVLPRRPRVAFVIDTSQSMSVTDPVTTSGEPSARQRAAAEVVAHLQGREAAFAFVAYGSYPVVNAGLAGGFVDDVPTVEASLSTLSRGEGVSDLQGALTAMRRLVEEEVATFDEQDLARTSYTVILLSDGHPSPVCSGGCDGEPLCDEPRESWCREPGSPGCDWLPYLRPCQDYNTDEALEGLVRELGGAARGARLRLHAVMLRTTDQLQAREDALRAKLARLAAAAGGQLVEVPYGSKLSFLDLLGEIRPE